MFRKARSVRGSILAVIRLIALEYSRVFDKGCPKSRNAGMPESRNAGMPESRNAGNQDPEILKPGMTFREGKRAK